jgi:hypothetical protein
MTEPWDIPLGLVYFYAIHHDKSGQGLEFNIRRT